MRLYIKSAYAHVWPMDRLEPASICNCLALRQASRHVTALYDRHLAPTGLRTTQFSVLMNLARSGPLSINELAALMVMDRTTMGRALRPLEREGLVAIGPGRDGRTRALAITESGRARLAAARARWRDAQSAFDEGYGAEAASALRTTLAQVVERV